MDVVAVPKLDFALSCKFWLFPVQEAGRSQNKDVEHHRLQGFLVQLLQKGFSPSDVFSSGDVRSRETSEVIGNQVRDYLQRPCLVHRRLQIDQSDPIFMLKTIVDSVDPERSVCVAASGAFLRNFYAALRCLDPNHIEGRAPNEQLELHPECVLELSVLHASRYANRCFVDHQYSITRRHRHKILSILLMPSGTAVMPGSDDDNARLTPHSQECLAGLAGKSGVRLGPMAGSVVFLADSDPDTRLSVAYLLEETDAAFLPIFVPVQKAAKIVRFINSLAAGSRVTLMASEAVLKNVARLLLGIDSIAAESIAPNTGLLLHHYTPSCSYDDFDLGTRCIETITTKNM